MTAAVSLKNVVKRYKRGAQTVEVLHHLDLEVPQGEPESDHLNNCEDRQRDQAPAPQR